MKRIVPIVIVLGMIILTGLRMGQLYHDRPSKKQIEYTYNSDDSEKKYGELGYIRNVTIPNNDAQKNMDLAKNMIGIQVEIKPVTYSLQNYRLMLNFYVNSWSIKTAEKLEDGYTRLTFSMMKKDLLTKKNAFLSLDNTENSTIPILVIPSKYLIELTTPHD